MKYVKFIAKKNNWFLEGSEALPETRFGFGRITPEQLEEYRDENGRGLFFVGKVKLEFDSDFWPENKKGDTVIDSEFECYDMFDIEETDDFFGVTNDRRSNYEEELNKFFKI